MSKKKQFKAESKRLLDLMIHSIYTHKEIFLRELISNASDAIDKLYYTSLHENISGINPNDFEIHLEIDETNRTLTISDNGIGMNKEELEENLGTIAKSGSLAFKEDGNVKEQEDIDIIGQFGVGFYAAFMVSDYVEVISKKFNEKQAYCWQSNAVDGYTISECDKGPSGTTIILHLKENSDDEKYDQYLKTFEIESLIKKYSDYIRYPITMEVEEQQEVASEDKEKEPVYETVKVMKTLNSMIPIWKKAKKDITNEEYNDFYKSKFNDFQDPLKTIHMNVEGAVSFTALLFIPSTTPHNYYSQDYQKGLQLYSRGIFIKDHAEELIPEHFRFVKGLVDSQDLSLNISREMLQHDRQLHAIASRIEKKIKSELENMLNNDRDMYERFWQNFGTQIKFGVYNDFGTHKELLQDLLLFYSSHEKKLITLDEYVGRMKDGQESIYFISGENIEKIEHLPQITKVKENGYEILYLVDNVDEFTLQALQSYQEKTFKNITQGDLDFVDEKEKKAIEKATDDNKDLLASLQEALEGKVQEVKLSSRLVEDPVCLTSGEGMSFEMEKVLSAMPEGNPYGMKATRILEINPNHDVFKALQKVYKQDKNSITHYADLLYDQALLVEGFPIDDPISFSRRIWKLMMEAIQ